MPGHESADSRWQHYLGCHIFTYEEKSLPNFIVETFVFANNPQTVYNKRIINTLSLMSS